MAATSGPDSTTGPVRPIVLLVDDEPSVRETLGRYLQLCGYEVLTADNPDDAFKILGQSRVDAVILDVRLARERSGLEVLQFLRLDEKRRELPVILLTGSEFTPVEEDIIRRHIAYVFYKPQGYSEVVQRLRKLLPQA